MTAMPWPTFAFLRRPFLLDGPGRTAATDVDQAALRRYQPRPGRPLPHVLVELRSADGGNAVEVWLDRRPVGRLDRAAGQRYGPVVADLQRRGETPGCTADIIHAGQGIQIELRLSELPPPLARSVPGHGPALRPILAGVGVIAVLVGITSFIGSGDDDRAAAASSLPVPAAVTGATSYTEDAISTAEPPTSSVAAPPPAIAPPVTTTVSVRATSVRSSTRPKPGAVTKSTTVPAVAPPRVAPTPTSRPPEPSTTTTTTTPTTTKPTTTKPTTTKPTTTTPPPPEPRCDSNYSGCVPIDTDVDCTGGSGNGPSYVSGPIRVTGTDIYGLDKDKDGIACE